MTYNTDTSLYKNKGEEIIDSLLNTSESKLLRMVNARGVHEEYAINEIYWRYQQEIWEYIKKQAVNGQDAENIFGNVWSTAIDEIYTIKGSNLPLKYWLREITNNEVSKHLTKKKPQQTPTIGTFEAEQFAGFDAPTSEGTLDLPKTNALTWKQSQVLRMQKQHGNEHVQRLLKNRAKPKIKPRLAIPIPRLNHRVQAKLSVNEPDDAYEKDADAVAEQVMRMPAPATPSQPTDDETKNKPNAVSSISHVQRKGDGFGGQDVASDVESKIASVQSRGGKPLPDSEREFFEPRMGVDLSNVRVHDNEIAVQTARDLNANAYTVGSDIVFGKGEYAPGSDSGRQLLAYELTHTVQQGSVSRVETRIKKLATIDALYPFSSLNVFQTTNHIYYFCFEMDNKTVKYIEKENMNLSKADFSAIKFEVALFAFEDGLIISEMARMGQLQLMPDGSLQTTQQPQLPHKLPADILNKKRLFFPIRTPATAGTYRLRCNLYYQNHLLQSRLITAKVTDTEQTFTDPVLTSEVDYTISRSLFLERLQQLEPN